MVEWGDYAEAYKAIHDKLDEIITKLDYPTDPAVQDVIDRADRLLGRVYGSQGQPLKQRATTHELMVQLVHQGVEYQAGGGGGSGLVQCQILNEAGDAWINEPYARDISDRPTRDLGKVGIAGFDVPLPSGANNIGDVDSLYDILMVTNQVDEVDYSWSADGTLNTQVFKKGGSTILTLTYTWNADGTLQKVVRT